MSVLCGKPTLTGPCQRPVSAPGGQCGVTHPALTTPTGAPPSGTPEPAAGPDPLAGSPAEPQRERERWLAAHDGHDLTVEGSRLRCRSCGEMVARPAVLVLVEGGVATVSVPDGVTYQHLDFDNWENPDEAWASRSDLLEEIRGVADPSGADGAEADWAAVESRLLGFLSNPNLFGATCPGCADQPVPGVAADGAACGRCAQYPAGDDAFEARDRVLTAAREFRLDGSVLERLVRSPGCPPDVAGALAAHPVERVRAAAAAHPATPPEVLVRLAGDPESGEAVLAAVAGNPSTPAADRAAAGLRSG